ncbi:hypothetical protein SDC9_127062 [bioreactor metagenome]|uniref:Uncharacterized protein n=1 Tax=bioreactor metagenome TaxID=1076179 RepID=A0A645CT00_9ZZZZ|nr:hypothetical protein [Christensenella sp.]
MDRSKLGKILLLTLALPFAAYLLIDCIAGYIPPTESYTKTPFQFEEAFNEQMAQYGMSIDIDSVNFSYGGQLKKVVPVVCADGSKITCTYFPTSERRKSIMQYIILEQELSGQEGEKVYLEQLLAFLMDAFITPMTVNKDESFEPVSSVSYNEALRVSREFVEGNENEKFIYVAASSLKEKAIKFERKTEEKTSLSVSLRLWNG